jgi:hypothetical protein
MNKTPQRSFANNALNIFLKPYGFKKKGSVWALLKKEFLLTIWFQKSQWSDIYYVNIGIQFENLDERLPSSNNGDIKFRLVDFSTQKPRGDFSLDIDLVLVQSLIKKQVIDVFIPLETKKEIKNLLAKPPRPYIVSVNAKKILGLPYEETMKSEVDIIVREWDGK